MKLTDARQLNWKAAAVATERIRNICFDARFTAPEDLGALQAKVAEVAERMTEIARALLITPPGGAS